MPRWTQQVGVSVVLVALTASAWSQTARYTFQRRRSEMILQSTVRPWTVRLIRLWPM